MEAILGGGCGVKESVNQTTSTIIRGKREGSLRVYLTTPEAAAYLRKSVSWLLRQPDIACLRGKPNLYAEEDLDAWFERHKIKPIVRL